MNPHFIFNALASLQTMILQADPGKANDYLVKLAALIRGSSRVPWLPATSRAITTQEKSPSKKNSAS